MKETAPSEAGSGGSPSGGPHGSPPFGQHSAAATPRKDPAYRLWELWRQGQRPDVRDFLTRHADLSLTQCVGALRVDQQERWLLGERVTAEDYLQQCFFLHDNEEHALDLVYGEFLLRERLGECPAIAEYEQRFPQFADRLRLQVELHRALCMSRENHSAVSASAEFQDRPTTPQARVGAGAGALPAVPGYEVIDILGRGGMGVVYKAWQLGLKRLVALKMVRGDDPAGADLLARFRAESAVLARLRHPNIVQIHEVGEHEGRPYFAMELVEGGSLDRKLAGAPQPARSAAELVATLARAVLHAHERGVVHRDLKPANVLLAEDGTPKVTDFGLAKLLAVGPGMSSLHYQTHAGVAIGTPSYMAPEQTGGRAGAATPAVDVYALGAVLYELLTGRPPLQGATALETLEQVRHQEPVPPRSLQPRVPRDLETVCLKCLQKEPHKRYASAGDLAADLARFLDGRPIQARPVSRRERCWKWAKRRPAVAALALALTLAVAGLLGLGAWSYAEIGSALDQANTKHRAAVSAAAEEARQKGLAEHQRRAAEREKAEAVRMGKKARQQTADARRKFQIARFVIDRLCTEVGQNQLLHQREMEGLRKQLLKAAVGYYDQFVQEGSDDPEMQAERARAYMRYGLIVSKIETPAKALELYAKGLAIFQDLAADPRADAHCWHEVARAHTSLGDLYFGTRGRHQAEAAYLKAIAIQQELPANHPSAAEHREHLASTCHNLGILYHVTGRLEESEETFRTALAMRAQLGREHPDNAGYRRSLAMTRTDLANLLNTAGRLKEAAVECAAAVAVNQKLVDGHKKVIEYRLDLARALVCEGNLCYRLRRLKDAEKAFDRAGAVYGEQVRRHPAIASYQHGLAICTRGLGMVWGDQGKRQQAVALFSRAGQIFGTLAERDRSFPEYAVNAAVCCEGLGILMYQSGRYEEALRWHDRAIERLQRVVSGDARDLLARSVLSRGHQGKGQALTQLQRYPEAMTAWAKALAVGGVGVRPWVETLRAFTRAQTGDHVRAAADVEPLLARKDCPPNLVYEAARVYAACSRAAAADPQLDVRRKERLAELHARRAVALVSRAHAEGQLTDGPTLEHLRTHRDLDPLRAREDFQALARRIEQEVKAAATTTGG